TFFGSVALLNNTRQIAEVNIASSSTYSERLLPSIHFMLQVNVLGIKDVEGFAVAAGPGSFTGIRIGLSTIKSLSFASGKPVAPVSSLEALALKLKNERGNLVCPLIDAKKGQIYAALFDSRGKRLKEMISQGVYSPDYFFSLLPSRKIISFIGNGVLVYKDRIIRYCRDRARFSSRSFFIAKEVGLLGYEILKKNKGLKGDQIQPFYFRKSQAEENY
ncbi:tRNA (adenosine(37)-N6)-threonylcarbamoyltransferase complex dimerization subunit type 1 TsaB, partial [bacterium]|nr:tRNA (adenosine(37)-N6)-threonylcarbamoyltransferase complex dimerization subunit type 1 TsaB [bacterium]